MSVCCEYCVLSGTSLCDGQIPRSEDSYRSSCVSEYDHEALTMRWSRPTRAVHPWGGREVSQ